MADCFATGESDLSTLTALKAAGSITRTTDRVALPSLPVFEDQPTSKSVVQGAEFNIPSWVSNPATIAFQWYKDGVPLPGETNASMFRPEATFEDAGNYHVTATNAAGTTTSNTATITIVPATLPVISTQPQGADLFAGQNFQVKVQATSNAPLKYQWYRDNVAIPNAVQFSYNISSASAATAGEYSVDIINAAGTVRSAPALFTVTSEILPRIIHPPISFKTNLGSYTGFQVYAEGPGPLIFQWYRNGVAIPGGTYPNLSIPQVSLGDVGEYYVTVSNPVGTVASDPVLLELYVPVLPEAHWSEAREFDGVMYFLFPAAAKIARYDLATENWLPTWDLVHAPTAFTVTTDAVYIAYGVTIKKYSRSLGDEMAFVTGPGSFRWIEVADNRLLTVYSDSLHPTAIATYNLATGHQNSPSSYINSAAQGFSYSTKTKRIYGRITGTIPSDITSVQINADGSVASEEVQTPYHGDFPEGTRTFLLNGGDLVGDEGGILYDTESLLMCGRLGGRIRDAISDGAAGYYTVNGTQVSQVDAKFRQTGYAQLSIAGARLSLHADSQGGSLIAFAQPSSIGALPGVQKVSLNSIRPNPAPAPIRGYGQKVTANRIVADENGVVYIHSKELDQILRWSTTSRSYLPSIPLSSKARYLAYSAPNRTLYFDNGYTQIRQVRLDVALPTETPFYGSPDNVTGLQTSGPNLLFADPSGATHAHYTVSPAGQLIDEEDSNTQSREFAWSEANQRMYFFQDSSSPNSLRYETIAPSGEITPPAPYYGEGTINPPIRVSPDGTAVLLGSGQLFHGTTLSLLGVLGGTNVDAAWTGSRLHTMRNSRTGTRIQSYQTGTYALSASVDVSGIPVGLVALGTNRLLAITSVLGYLHYWELQADTLAVSSHRDTSVVPIPADSDLNGDGHADILWQNTATGQRDVWFMDGTNLIGPASLGVIPLEWSMAAAADFNGDGYSDILAQNYVTGQREIWLMQGTSRAGTVALGAIPFEWSIVAAADFNGDGHADILWQNSVSGQREIWRMQGVNPVGTATLGTISPEWFIAAAADFTGDGHADIVLQNANTGEREIRLVHDNAFTGTVALGVIPLEWSIAAAADLNGDGHPDLLWQNTVTGRRDAWLMHGTALSSTIILGDIPLEWSIAGPQFRPPGHPYFPRGDFNGDGKADILWQNSATGDRSLWLMNGVQIVGGAGLGNEPVAWTITGKGDFNGDGKTDIFWSNTSTGDRALWLMDGPTVIGTAFLGTIPVSWSMAGCGDFDGDGKTDIFWSNTTTGDCAIWLMDGGAPSGGGYLTTLAPEWQVRGTADFNGDGKADILWSNPSTGERAMWLMNGVTVTDGASLGTLSMDWQFSATADFNGDGKSDVALTNTTTGDRAMWLMKGTSIVDNQFLGTVPPSWVMAASDDYDGDGKADILWSSTDTGSCAIWIMNGATATGGGFITTLDPNWRPVP